MEEVEADLGVRDALLGADHLLVAGGHVDPNGASAPGVRAG